MKWAIALSVFVALAASQEAGEDLVLAEECDEAVCLPPDCRCSSSRIPGDLAPSDVPQFVVVTFDDVINIDNILTYRELLYGRQNLNGCRVGTTFFVNHEYTNTKKHGHHEYTDYQLVNELYNEGFEIGLHSVNHQTPHTYWTTATYEDMKKQFGNQRAQMSHFANIPYDDIKGIRIPFLQMTGNASFQVIADFGLQYDSTWPTIDHVHNGIWPYTLDYASTQDCVIPPCPTASIPGVWVFPMISWLDLDGDACVMADSCINKPDQDDEEAWFQFIVGNFERHYLGNRMPFPFYIHELNIAETTFPAVRSAFARFLDLINNMSDVFMVNSHEVIEWVKNPIPVDEYRKKECRPVTSTTCPANSCGPLISEHNQWPAYWLQICNVCPNTHPWLGNPFGQ